MTAGSKEWPNTPEQKNVLEQKDTADQIDTAEQLRTAEQGSIPEQKHTQANEWKGSRNPDAKKATARKDSHAALEQQPLATLRAKARKKHISGRSSMDKMELIQALRRS
ncbi:MAG: hypothetical protein K0Q78_343 [Cellvibrio sp.]|jgi:hypothetical protein|nr:hypothetical protein [Cellvibrio sp.]